MLTAKTALLLTPIVIGRQKVSTFYNKYGYFSELSQDFTFVIMRLGEKLNVEKRTFIDYKRLNIILVHVPIHSKIVANVEVTDFRHYKYYTVC